MPKTIYVYESWSDETPMKLGRLYVDQARGSEQYAFEYDETWLTTSRFAYVLDPDLSLYKGRQYPIDKNTFGIFADSAPDRWGRLLMQRREKFIAEINLIGVLSLFARLKPIESCKKSIHRPSIA